MKNRFLLFLLFMPFLSFGDWYVKPWYWTSSTLSPSTPSVSYSSECRSSPSSSPFIAFFNGLASSSSPVWFGVSVNSSNNSLLYPATYAPRGGVSNSTASVNHFIRDSDLPNVYFHPSAFPDVVNLYSFASSLFAAGYRGVGFQVFSGSKFNFNPPLLFSDVVNGTNSLYKAQLFNYLSSLSSGVNQLVINSDSGLSSFRDFASDFSSLNFYSLSPTSSVSSSSVLYDNPVFWFGSQSSYPFDSVVDSISQSLDLQDSSLPDSSARRAFVSDSLKSLFSDSLRAYLLDQSSGVNRDFSRYVENPSMSQSVIAGHYSTPFTNAMHKMTTDWKEGVTNELAQNTANITNQLAQWKKDLKGHNDSVTNDLDRIGNTVADVERNTKGVADLLSGSLPNKAHVIVDNQELPVRVTNWPLQFDINISANDLDMLVNASSSAAKDILDALTNRIDNITNSVASLSPFFEAITNLQLLVNSSITNLDFSVSNIVFDSFHALLLDDYADYITNQYYSSAVDTFKDDYPSVYTNLLKFGLSTRSGEGNFWSLFSSTLFYQSALVCGMLEDLSTVRKFADDHIEGGFQGGVTSLIDKFPSPTQLQDYLMQASNEVLKIQVSSDDFKSAYSYMTNSAVNAFSPFHGIFSSVPESLVFFKTGNEKYITIPVSRGGNAWLVIRLCFSFSLAAVNVILFPKFVLMVIALLSKLSKRFVKFVPTDR